MNERLLSLVNIFHLSNKCFPSAMVLAYDLTENHIVSSKSAPLELGSLTQICYYETHTAQQQLQIW